jgi:hypothetical protein
MSEYGGDNNHEEWDEFEPEQHGAEPPIMEFDQEGLHYVVKPGALVIKTYLGTDQVYNHAYVYADVPPDKRGDRPGLYFLEGFDEEFPAFFSFALATGCEMHLNVPTAPQDVQRMIIGGETPDLPSGRRKLFYDADLWEAPNHSEDTQDD